MPMGSATGSKCKNNVHPIVNNSKLTPVCHLTQGNLGLESLYRHVPMVVTGALAETKDTIIIHVEIDFK